MLLISKSVKNKKVAANGFDSYSNCILFNNYFDRLALAFRFIF